MLVFDMTVLHYLNVSTNNVNLIQGITIITHEQLNVIAVNPFNIATGDIDNIVYIINNLRHGQFELIDTATPLTSFTQEQINNNNIQFIYTGNGSDPSFDFSLSNGNITAGPYSGKISLIRAPQIISNKLICNEGQTVPVTSNDISAIDIDGTSNPNLLFIVDEMGNGQFELTSNPGVIITQFSQNDINENRVQFTPIDSGINIIVTVNDIKPFYQLTVTNGQNQSSINNATIDFDAAPKIIQNQLTLNKGASIILSSANLNATDIDNNFLENLTFQVSNETNGHFESTNNPSVKLSYFTLQQINNQQIKFVHDNSDVAPNYRINVTDGRATSPQSSPTVSFNKKEAGLNVGLVAGSVIAGIAGLGMLIAGGGFFAKTYRDAATREPYPFANAVHKHLKLNGMDNFKTEQGQKFVRLIEEDMAQALSPYGFDIQNLHLKAVDDLAKKIAAEAKNKISVSTTIFGYSEIQLDQLESKINDIAQAVGLHKDMDQPINSSLENDSEIGLKNFMPSFSLKANKFENV